MIPVVILDAAVKSAGLVIVGVSQSTTQGVSDATHTWHQNGVDWYRVDWVSAPTAPQIADANTVIQTTDLSQSGQATADNLAERNFALTLVSDLKAQNKLLRASLLVMADENNILRQRDVGRAADVAAATNFADLKTRWAARPALTQRTKAQAMAAITNKLNSGTADNAG